MGREIQSSIVEKCVAVVDLLAQTRGRLSQTEIANATGFNKSSTHRILSILMGLGLVHFDDRDRSYSTGQKLVSWAQAAWEKMDLSLIEDQDLIDLSEATDMNVSIGVQSERTITFTRTRIPHPYRLAAKTGGQSELYNTAAGKVLLAHMSEEELAAYFKQTELEKFTETTLTTEAALRKDMQKTRERGYAISDREEFYQVVGIAAPILDYDRRVLAAASLWIPLKHASFSQLLDNAPKLLAMTEKISARFGQMT